MRGAVPDKNKKVEMIMMRESDFIHPWNDIIPDADIF